MTDWADTKAFEVLHYLGKCRTDTERREFIAAHLRNERATGKVEATRECAEAIGVVLTDKTAA